MNSWMYITAKEQRSALIDLIMLNGYSLVSLLLLRTLLQAARTWAVTEDKDWKNPDPEVNPRQLCSIRSLLSSLPRWSQIQISCRVEASFWTEVCWIEGMNWTTAPPSLSRLSKSEHSDSLRRVLFLGLWGNNSKLFVLLPPKAVHFFLCFAPQMALLGFFIARWLFSHTLYDLLLYAAARIRTHFRELHLFEGPLFRTLNRLSYRGLGNLNNLFYRSGPSSSKSKATEAIGDYNKAEKLMIASK